MSEKPRWWPKGPRPLDHKSDVITGRKPPRPSESQLDTLARARTGEDAAQRLGIKASTLRTWLDHPSRAWKKPLLDYHARLQRELEKKVKDASKVTYAQLQTIMAAHAETVEAWAPRYVRRFEKGGNDV